jgi:hypothetical protein
MHNYDLDQVCLNYFNIKNPVLVGQVCVTFAVFVYA